MILPGNFKTGMDNVEFELSGHHLRIASSFLRNSRNPHIASTRPFFREFFQQPDDKEVSIVVGADSFCRGSFGLRKCGDLTDKNRCVKDYGRDLDYIDREIADFWGLPVGTKTTVGEIRKTLLMDRQQRRQRM